MITQVLRSSWRLVVKRAAADWLILTAALITILLATTLLASGPIYANAVTLSGARQTLADAAVDEANLEVSWRAFPDRFDEGSAVVEEEMRRATSTTGAEVLWRVTADSYELPVRSSADLVEIATFRAFEGIDDHTTLAEGRWPQAGTDPVEMALPQSVALRLALGVGDELELINRRNVELEVTVRLVGIYTIDDLSDPFWYADAVDTEGLVESAGFARLGPFVVDRSTLLTELSSTSALFEWRAFPDFDELLVDEIAALRQAAGELEDRLNAWSGVGNTSFTVDTNLERILTTTERSLTVTRSGVLMLSVQLSILAGYALVLTAGLLVETRRVETNLLRSRGADNRQVLAMSVMEGLLLTVPAAAVAPWLARQALGTLGGIGPLSAVEVTIRGVTGSAYVLAFLAAVGCVLALAVPAYRSAKSFSDASSNRARRKSRSMGQRTGIDLALLVLAAIAFWQLNTHGASITSATEGRLGIDPLLIGAPALGLLAGAVLALRTVPLVAAIGERLAARGRSTVRALSAWQVSRRPDRYARSALLLLMAITIGFFAAAYATTWARSQSDQADYAVGADIRASPNRRINASVGDLQLQQAHLDLADVERSMPVVRKTGELARSGGSGQFVMLDASAAADVVVIRDDLTTTAFGSLMGALLEGRPELATVPIPGEPSRIGLDLEVEVQPLPPRFGLDRWNPLPEGAQRQVVPDFRLRTSARLVVQDRLGFLHRVDLGPIPTDAGPIRVEADLRFIGDDGQSLPPAYPLSLVDVEIQVLALAIAERQAVYTVDGIVIGDADSWTPLDFEVTSTAVGLARSQVTGVFSAPSIAFTEEQPESGLAVDISTGQSASGSPVPVSFSLRPRGTRLPERFPVVVTERFLEQSASNVGDELRLVGLRARASEAVIVGSLIDFPTVDPERGPAILLDLPTFQMMNYEVGARIDRPDEHWLAVTDGAEARTVSTLSQYPIEALSVSDRLGTAAGLKSDPVALGTIGTLSLGFVAAAAFAAVGFAVSSAVSARERLTEFGLLRALGLSQRQLATWLAVEHGLLVVASLALGTLIGVLLSSLLLPLVALNQAGGAALPEVHVVYPWSTVARLDLAVLAVLALIVTVLALLLRRLGLGSLLRLGEAET